VRSFVCLLILAAITLTGCGKEQQPSQSATTAGSQPAAQGINEKDREGLTPLLRAVKENNATEVESLIGQGADVDVPMESGVTPVMIAAGMGNNDIIRMLAGKGADVNARTPGNYTALMSAALNGQIETVKLLLELGADPSIKNNANMTAASYAREKEHKQIVDLLAQADGSEKQRRAK